MVILTRAFWDYAGDRALKSFAQTVIVLAGAQVPPIDVLHTNWLTILAAALAMALVSVCTSVVGYSIPPQRANPVAPPAAQPVEPVTEPIPPVEFPLEHGQHEAQGLIR